MLKNGMSSNLSTVHNKASKKANSPKSKPVIGVTFLSGYLEEQAALIIPHIDSTLLEKYGQTNIWDILQDWYDEQAALKNVEDEDAFYRDDERIFILDDGQKITGKDLFDFENSYHNRDYIKMLQTFEIILSKTDNQQTLLRIMDFELAASDDAEATLCFILRAMPYDSTMVYFSHKHRELKSRPELMRDVMQAIAHELTEGGFNKGLLENPLPYEAALSLVMHWPNLDSLAQNTINDYNRKSIGIRSSGVAPTEPTKH